MTARARLVYGAEFVGAKYAPSANAMLVELKLESGIVPLVINLGGDRTEAEQRHLINIGLSTTMLSDHLLSRGGRALDINNWRAIVNRIGYARYNAICNKHGWKNQQINGAPFPQELWHRANHSAIPQGWITSLLKPDITLYLGDDMRHYSTKEKLPLLPTDQPKKLDKNGKAVAVQRNYTYLPSNNTLRSEPSSFWANIKATLGRSTRVTNVDLERLVDQGQKHMEPLPA